MKTTTLLCNGAVASQGTGSQCVSLHYLDGQACDHFIRIKVQALLRRLNYLPARVYDLVEIASYVYAADRLVHRGDTDLLEYHTWQRDLHFIIRVRDFEFWSSSEATDALVSLLSFLAGHSFTFEFQPGHDTPPSHLFEFPDAGGVEDLGTAAVSLFSGGLDSFTGARQLLAKTDQKVCLVSHQPAQTTTVKSQQALLAALQREYPGRVLGFPFECGLTKLRAREETQRTRMFLYFAIAFAVACAAKAGNVYAFENGVTSINIAKRQDLMNARASRTTHPNTIRLLRRFLTVMAGTAVRLHTPFEWMTKCEVLKVLKECGGAGEYSSTVSCSKTYKTKRGRTHCGGCSQCVDRRFAAFAAGLQEEDECTLYDLDFLRDPMDEEHLEARGTVVDFLSQARVFLNSTADSFHFDYLAALAEVREGCPEPGEAELIERVWALCNRHGASVRLGLLNMRSRHDDPMMERTPNSLFDLVAKQKHLADPATRVCDRLAHLLVKGIRLAFQHTKPERELGLNDQIEALLSGHEPELRREFPAIPVGPKRLFPDHGIPGGVVVEGKYPRKGSRPIGAIVDEILADIAGYGPETHVLFAVYDPDGLIANDGSFRADLEARGRCSVVIAR